MHNTLFLGSSLTTAFYDWYKTSPSINSDRHADFVMCHGALWLPSRFLGEIPFKSTGAIFSFPKKFQVLSSDGKTLNQNMFGEIDGNISIEHMSFDLSSYEKMIFTVPMLFNDISFDMLFRNGFGILNQESEEVFRSSGLNHGLSNDAFLAIHRERFGYAFKFLTEARQCNPDLNIFIAPAVLPPATHMRFTDSWRRLHQLEMEIVFQSLEREFGSISMRQPPETIKRNLVTDSKYMADETHHYNAQLVQILYDSYNF